MLRSRFCRLFFLALYLAVALLTARPSPAHAQDVVGYLLGKINGWRAENGLGPLSLNSQLTAAAQGHSYYLATHIYAHPHRQENGSLPQDRAYAAGYTGRASENVVGGTGASMEWAFNWWLQSGVHNRNILGNWTEVGIAYSDGSGYGIWYVTVFGNAGRAPAFDAESANAGKVPGATTSGGVAAAPRPTKPPPPTYTPSATYTPSITYTPRATYTLTYTPSYLPPTATAIVLVVAQPTSTLADSAPVPSTPTSPPPTAIAALPAPTELALATPVLAPPAAPATSNNPLRNIIPLAILANVLIVGGLLLGGLWRKFMHKR
jgi:hypothetical protein